ncbi:MAG: hypothetical protein U9Q82_04055 [Chloroflexota bacterium]|nr:hypothetical protein [Chloroflexota bacterium]
MSIKHQDDELNPNERERVDKFSRDLALALNRILDVSNQPPNSIKVHSVPTIKKENDK